MSTESRITAGKGILALGYIGLFVGTCLFLVGQLNGHFSQPIFTGSVFAFFALAFLCFAFAGVLSGRISGKYLSYDRERRPGSFLFDVFFQALIGLACAFIALRGILGPQ